MARDGSLVFDTRIDQGGFESGAGAIKNAGMNLVKSLGVAFSAGAIAKAIVSLGKQSIELASDLQEVQNVVDVTFGDGAAKINDWADSAGTAFGLTTLQAKQFTGTMGAMLKSSGVASEDLAEMSTTLTGLAGDFASFYNITSEDAFQKIRAGISGETEPLKQLGINMSVANLEAYALSQGIETAYTSMSQGEQIMLRYNYLLAQSADAQGDFSRTSDSFANQQRITSLAISDLGAAIGEKLLPAATKAMAAVGGFVGGLTDAFTADGVSGAVEYITDSFPVATAAVLGLASAYAAMSIVQAVSAATASFAAVQASLNALTVAGTVEELANIGALTVKQLVVALLTGKITLLTFAQQLLNAAFYASPVGWLAAGIAALVTAVVLLYKANKSASDSATAFNRAIESTEKAAQEATAAYNEEIDVIEESTETLQNQVSVLEELTGKSEKTAADNAQIQATVEKLNSSIPNLNLAYDELTGTLNKHVSTLREVIQAQANQQKMNALIERNSSLYDTNAQKADELAEARRRLSKAMGALSDYEDKLAASGASSGRAADAQSAALGSYKTAVEIARDTVNELKAGIKANRDEMAANEDEYNRLAGVLDETEAALNDVENAMSDLTEEATNMFDRISEESKYSMQDMIDNIRANATAVTHWYENIEKIGDKLPSALLDPMIAEGPGKWAGAIAEMANASDEELAEMASAFYAAGNVSVRGLANGIDDAAIDAIKAAARLGQAVSGSLRNALQIQSPSKVMFKIGGFAVDGFVNAIKDGIPAVHEIMGDFTDAVTGRQYTNYAGNGGGTHTINNSSNTRTMTVQNVFNTPVQSPSQTSRVIRQTMEDMLYA